MVQKTLNTISFGQGIKPVKPVAYHSIYNHTVIGHAFCMHVRSNVFSGIHLVWIFEVLDKQGLDNRGCTTLLINMQLLMTCLLVTSHYTEVHGKYPAA